MLSGLFSGWKKPSPTQKEAPAASAEPMTTTLRNVFGGFRFRAATHPGVGHLRKRINNQDSLTFQIVEIGDRSYAIGLWSDGCTGKQKVSRTEVGSALLTLYAFSEIRALLHFGVAIEEIPKQLYPKCVGYVDALARLTTGGSDQERAVFVGNFILCTLCGFIMDGEHLVTLQSGDGFFIVNDHNICIDENNAPLYLGYHCVDREYLQGQGLKLPDSFVTNVYDVSLLKQFAGGTDGLLKKRMVDGQAETYIDPEERREIFEHRRKAPAGLQWWLNKKQADDSRFEDDTTLITVERIDEAEEPAAAPPEEAPIKNQPVSPAPANDATIGNNKLKG